jgi:hypothetical protein
VIRNPRYDADKARGRLLHDRLLAEAKEALTTHAWPAQDDVPLPIRMIVGGLAEQEEPAIPTPRRRRLRIVREEYPPGSILAVIAACVAMIAVIDPTVHNGVFLVISHFFGQGSAPA